MALPLARKKGHVCFVIVFPYARRLHPQPIFARLAIIWVLSRGRNRSVKEQPFGRTAASSRLSSATLPSLETNYTPLPELHLPEPSLLADLSSMTVDPSPRMSQEMMEKQTVPRPISDDSTQVHSLKEEVSTLRHDLAERNALLATVQKQLLVRHQPQANGIETVTVRPQLQTNGTGKVIEQLHLEIDHLKKELADSKTQIHVAKVARDRADRSLQEQQKGQQTLRQEIDALKRMLDRKERQVKEMEQNIKDSDKKSSDMKFERDNANTSLRRAELKATNLERELREAQAGKEQAEHEYELLSKEVKNFKRRYAEDVDAVRKEFDELRQQMNATARKLEDSILETHVRVEELTSGSTVDVKELDSIHEKLKENQQKYATQFGTELENMKRDVEASSKKTEDHMNEVNKMRGEIVGKLNWLSRIEKART